MDYNYEISVSDQFDIVRTVKGHFKESGEAVDFIYELLNNGIEAERINIEACKSGNVIKASELMVGFNH